MAHSIRYFVPPSLKSWLCHRLQEGILDDVEGIFGMHVSPVLPIGTVSFRSFFAASARFLATIKGKGGHAAAPPTKG